MLDLRIYVAGGKVALRGGNLYRANLGRGLYFTYPPIAALAFALVSGLPMADLRWLLTVASIVALAATLWVTLGLLGCRRPAGRLGAALAATGVALWLQPVVQTFDYGQINLILMLIMLADLARPDSARLKGAGVGLAAGVKLTPLIFIPYLLLTRRIKAAAVALAAFAATIAVSALALPRQARQYWLGLMFMNTSRTGNTAYVGNQSLNGALGRLLGGPAAAKPAWTIVAAVVAAAGLLIAVGWARRGQELTGILICALTGLLVSPVSWTHHWVWAAPALVGGASLVLRAARLRRPQVPGRRAGLRAGPALAVLAVAALLAAPFFEYPLDLVPAAAVQGHHRVPAGQLAAGDLYVLTGLVILVLAGCALAAGRRRAAALAGQGRAGPAVAAGQLTAPTGVTGPAGPRSPTG
jgi:alpha-1,2-mannosyltransferase